MKIIDKLTQILSGDPTSKLEKIVPGINRLEKEIKKLGNEEIKTRTADFKERLKNSETLDGILPEAYALVREAARRTLGQRHFDVQMLGGIVLHQGKIAEMKTGEGKTLVATLPAYLNALLGKGVHIVTVNDYLAKRDTVWMGQIYHLLGLSVGCITHEASYIYDSEHIQKVQNSKFSAKGGSPPEADAPPESASGGKIQNGNSRIKNNDLDKERDTLGGFKVFEEFLRPVSRKEAYGADITYGTNNEFGFDYLKDNLAYSLEAINQRGFNFAIIDEVDSILIDEARTPLIISMPSELPANLYSDFAALASRLIDKIDYVTDEKMRAVSLTGEGISKVEKILGIGNLYDLSRPQASAKGLLYIHHLEQALKARILFKKDRDYIVKNGEVVIIDEFTGRILPGRRFSEGLHQAIEAKEGAPIQRESKTLASITFQNYFRLYKKLAGMTGTAKTSAEEFEKVYGLEVVSIPTNQPMIRADLPDVVYKNGEVKWRAIVKEIKEKYEKSQPVLVGTLSIERNEHLSVLLKKEAVPFEILNAKNHEREGEIIAQAGKLKAVTIATNMAGRGVDIVLGGSPQNDPEQSRRVSELGGLHVIGTDRHEARRIDNQLRGRSGRQGDPGSTRFFISLEDDLMRIFGGEKIKNLIERFNLPEDMPIENKMISKAIEAAQSKIEGFNFDVRKHVLEFDEVLNKHRETIYRLRREFLVLNQENKKKQGEKIKEIIQEELGKIIDFHFSAGQEESFKSIAENIKAITNLDLSEDISKAIELNELKESVISKVMDKYEGKGKKIGEDNWRQAEKQIYFQTIDMFWMNHLENMDYLRDSVRLRAWGQRDPLVEYKNEGYRMFQELLSSVNLEFISILFKIDVEPTFAEASAGKPSLNQKIGLPVEVPPSGMKVGRNDPCPCGATKPDGRPVKYKHCHGK